MRPPEFLRWAEERLEQTAPTLSNALTAVHVAVGKPEDRQRALLAKQRHRERCRGVASLLWEKHPAFTKMQIAKLPELTLHGCEGTAYDPETLSDWIKPENPNRKPGRRPQQ